MLDRSQIIAGNAEGVAAAESVLRAGGIVAVPSETVYGLAARADDADAVARIYAAKGRPSFNPLIVHVSGVAQASELVDIDPVSRALMAAFWPGGLTLVLPTLAGANVAAIVAAGLNTLAVRCPAHPVLQALIRAVGPLAAPSANASGSISSTTAAHVAASLGPNVGVILDGGQCSAGVESTIVRVRDGGWELLRPGAVAVEAIIAVAGACSPVAASDRVIAPGMMASHYAPVQPVRLGVTVARADEFHLGFGPVAGDVNLSAKGDVIEAAARLFDLMHLAQASGRAGIAVAPVPTTGLGLAINDRLQRAAAPR